ncbi:MAG TPA: DUF6183 family protein [Euzebyales bacterium]|nr:DUF6183 family protein [Euzebyales bacterium]
MRNSMLGSAHLQPLVDTADVPALLRAVDGCCATRAWDALVDLARRCRDAIELGRQLWPVAMHIEYRLAYEAPGPYAAGVLRPGAARFALGPLTEVAASTHTWDDLAPGIGDLASAAMVAQERVIRGEDLRGELPPQVTELPLRLQPWEPPYALPAYRDREALFPAPDVVGAPAGAAVRGRPARRLPDDPAIEALRAAVETWTTQSEGRVAAVAVEGDAAGAVAHLSPVAAITPITAAQALAWLQWAGASGGAHGRRPGGAAGRFAAWWALAALAGFTWPDHAGRDEDFAGGLGEVLDELRWYRWAPASDELGAGHEGWHLHLAVHDPVDGLAWAVSGADHPEAAPAPATSVSRRPPSA